MPRPALAPGALLLMATDNPDEWTWAEARPLLATGARVRLVEWDGPVFELQENGTWTDDVAHLVAPVEERAAVLVRLAAEAEGELVALPRPPARPTLPAALDLPDDPVEVRVRDVIVEAGARSLGLLVEDMRANPARALRRLRVAERFARVFREGLAELGLDDDDGGVDGDYEAMGIGDGRRRRRRLGLAGGHAYGGQMDQQTALNGAVRAQHIQALTQTIERTAPNGAAPHPGVHEAAVRELALLFPGADGPRPPDEPAGAPNGTILGTEDAR